VSIVHLPFGLYFSYGTVHGIKYAKSFFHTMIVSPEEPVGEVNPYGFLISLNAPMNRGNPASRAAAQKIRENPREFLIALNPGSIHRSQ
jgi:hypothetical protein